VYPLFKARYAALLIAVKTDGKKRTFFAVHGNHCATTAKYVF
jgi:hypothetical protein